MKITNILLKNVKNNTSIATTKFRKDSKIQSVNITSNISFTRLMKILFTKLWKYVTLFLGALFIIKNINGKIHPFLLAVRILSTLFALFSALFTGSVIMAFNVYDLDEVFNIIISWKETFLNWLFPNRIPSLPQIEIPDHIDKNYKFSPKEEQAYDSLREHYTKNGVKDQDYGMNP